MKSGTVGPCLKRRDTTTRYDLTGPDGPISVEVLREGDAFTVKVGEKTYHLRLKPTDEPDTVVAEVSDKPVHVRVQSAGSQGVELVVGGERMYFEKARAMQAVQVPVDLQKTQQPSDALSSPMPGKVMSVMARSGDAVKQGDALIVIESMKMEVAVRSDRDGIVDEPLVSEGDSVKKGQALLKFRAA